MVPSDATGEEISELPAVQIPAETGVWQREWRQTFRIKAILDRHRETTCTQHVLSSWTITCMNNIIYTVNNIHSKQIVETC